MNNKDFVRESIGGGSEAFHTFLFIIQGSKSLLQTEPINCDLQLAIRDLGF